MARALARARVVTKLATIPFVAICVGVFLPTTLRRSPFDDIRRDMFFTVLIGPSFGMAFFFAVVLLRSKARRVLSRSTRGAATTALAGYAIAMTLYVSLSEEVKQPWFLLVPVVGCILLTRVHAARGWRRWAFIIASYGVLSALAEIYVGSEVASPCGLVCLPAYAALLVLSVVGTWPVARPRATDARRWS
jgi:hypothetical protein